MNREVETTPPEGRVERADRMKLPARPRRERTSPGTFLREVRGELKRVAWPSRTELLRYSVVVLIAVTLLTLYVFLLDQAFGQVVFQIFG